MSVITESEMMEDSPQFNVGEKVILFLYQKPIFGDKPSGNDYTIVNLFVTDWITDNIYIISEINNQGDK